LKDYRFLIFLEGDDFVWLLFHCWNSRKLLEIVALCVEHPPPPTSEKEGKRDEHLEKKKGISFK
jgi:hypothetical protein